MGHGDALGGAAGVVFGIGGLVAACSSSCRLAVSCCCGCCLFGSETHGALGAETDVHDAGAAHDVERLVRVFGNIVVSGTVELDENMVEGMSNEFLSLLSDYENLRGEV